MCRRAVSLLPRIDQLWYKYIHMEEMVKETAKARLIFDRWMAFEPDHAAWMAYIKVGTWRLFILKAVHGFMG
jgi:crooked neck